MFDELRETAEMHPAATSLDEALAELATVAAAVEPRQWNRPTACAPWTVADVLAHTIGITDKFTRFAAGDDTPRGATVDATIELTRAASRTAWAACDFTRRCHLPFGTFNAEDAAAINAMDALVHTWDIAMAIGVDYRMPAHLVPASIRIARRLVTPDSVAAGQFHAPGAARSVATGQELLLALTGRL